MPVPITMADLAPVAGDNYPVGSEPIGNNLDNYLRAHAALIRQGNAVASSSMPSGSTVNVANANGESVLITGNSTITSLGAGFVGCKRELRFSGSATLTHSSNLQLQGAQNATTDAGDVFTFRCIGSNTWVQVGRSTARTNDPVTISENQVITGKKTFQSEGGTTTIFERTNSTVNAVLEAKTTAGSVFFGQGSAGCFDIGGSATLNDAGNRWARFTSSGLDVEGGVSAATMHVGGVAVVPSSRGLIAGNGLTGGGTLSSDRSFALGTPSSITPSSSNSVSASSHTHNITGFAALDTNNVFTGPIQTIASPASGTLTYLRLYSGGSHRGGIWSYSSGTSLYSHGTNILIRPNGDLNSSNQFTFATSGVATGVDWSATSDERLKKNIRSTYGRRELIEALRLCRYEWKSDGRSAVGVIAQEVQKLAPEYVHKGEDGMLSVDKASLALEAVMALAELQGVR